MSVICPELSRVCSFQERMLVDGRCLLVCLCSHSLGLYERVHIINLRNYGLTGGQVSYIGEELDKIFQDSFVRPKEEFGI